MLETPQERVELLKAGISGKKIEELYIICNNFKIVHNPMLCEIGVGLSCPTLALHHKIQEKDTFPIIMLKEVKKMEEKKGDGIKILLNDVDKEFYRITPHLR